VEDLVATVPTRGSKVGTWAVYSIPNTYLEYAAFADLTYHFTDRFDVQIGAVKVTTGKPERNYYGCVRSRVFGLPSPVNYTRSTRVTAPPRIW